MLSMYVGGQTQRITVSGFLLLTQLLGIDKVSPALKTSLLLVSADKNPPILPDGLSPYVAPVPRFPARTVGQVKTKSAVWPVFYNAYDHNKRREEAQRWTHYTIQWFQRAINVIQKEAKRVQTLGEVCIHLGFFCWTLII
jgi:hypothetical protein